MADKINILVVDDEADIREILQFNLESEGYLVDTATSAEEALRILSPKHQLILLDVMMDGMSGFRMAERLRKEKNSIPIIFLTAKDTENDMLTGFSIGGDDYVSKPFSIKEVSARVKAILKRMKKNSDVRFSEELKINGLSVFFDTKQLKINNEEIILTKKEFEILTLLMKNPGRIFTRGEILDCVWNNESFVLERTIDVHITRLRKKLGEYGDFIVNRTGYGYCFIKRNEK